MTVLDLLKPGDLRSWARRSCSSLGISLVAILLYGSADGGAEPAFPAPPVGGAGGVAPGGPLFVGRKSTLITQATSPTTTTAVTA